MKIKPRARYILATFVMPAGGEIILPDNYTGQLRRVRVLVVGPEVKDIEPGQHILVTPAAAPIAADPNDSDIFLLHEEHVAATCIYKPEDDVPRSSLVVTA